MCDRPAFEKIRDAIGELQKADAAQSEQIKTLFKTTEEQGENIKDVYSSQLSLVKWLVSAIIGVLLIAVLALVFGALGKDGFNAVTNAAREGAAPSAPHAISVE